MCDFNLYIIYILEKEIDCMKISKINITCRSVSLSSSSRLPNYSSYIFFLQISKINNK